MNNKILLTLLLYSSVAHTQSMNNFMNKLIEFKTFERNKKNIVIFKEHTTEPVYIFSANNGKSKEFRSCKWEVKCTNHFMSNFINELSAINVDYSDEIKNKNYSIFVKRKKIRVQFANSRCIQDHKTHYFQESCNRKFSFVLNKEQANKFVSKIEDSIIEDNILTKKR